MTQTKGNGKILFTHIFISVNLGSVLKFSFGSLINCLLILFQVPLFEMDEDEVEDFLSMKNKGKKKK